ncbi:unnamed protein product [Adineta ricciae]|uniref:EF-hand domain-containing protein n=1 Tax=Adineta ricciae TaxID=249248 RepID=A0A814TFR9_ADIRI|nr:unnamed protein product [Adineta ricciae]CAF1582359.1 unnamed protein product [Adineta ricciae]
MGSSSSKKPFSEWDLVRFSDVTGVPLSMVEKIHEEFATTTGNDNKMDKREFRHLYKKMFINTQASSLPSALPPMFSENELNRLSDYVFETYDFDGTGLLSFEEFAEAYLMLSHHEGISPNGISFLDRFNYVLDQNNSPSDFISREQAERIFNRLNKYNHWITSKTNPSDDSWTPSTANWESHWGKLDDGSNRVLKEKFVDYITASNDYKHNFDPATI